MRVIITAQVSEVAVVIIIIIDNKGSTLYRKGRRTESAAHPICIILTAHGFIARPAGTCLPKLGYNHDISTKYTATGSDSSKLDFAIPMIIKRLARVS